MDTILNDRFNMLEIEYQYLQDNLDEFLSEYLGKTIVIIGKKIIAVYDCPQLAYNETVKDHDLGTFLIETIDGSTNEPAIFHTMVHII